jgi:glutathione S-transferase
MRRKRFCVTSMRRFMGQRCSLATCERLRVWIKLSGSLLVAVISFNRFLAPLLSVPTDEAVIAAAVPKARICVDALEQLRASQLFLAGNDISIADLMLAPQLEIFMATSEGHALLAGRGLADWLAMMAERSSLKATTRERLQSALKAA